MREVMRSTASITTCRGSLSAIAKEAMAVNTIASQIRITRCKCIENSLLMSGGFTVLYR